MRPSSMQRREEEPTRRTTVDDHLHGAAFRSSGSEAVFNSRSIDGVRQPWGSAEERVGEGEAEAGRSLLLAKRNTASRARTADEEGGVAAHTLVDAGADAAHRGSPDQMLFSSSHPRAPAAPSCAAGSLVTAARSSRGTTEETQKSRSSSGRETDTATSGEQQASVLFCGSYALSETEEAAATTHGRNRVLQPSAADESSGKHHSSSSSSTITSTNSGATSSTCLSSNNQMIRECCLDPSTAEAPQQQQQVSPRCIAPHLVRGVDMSLGTSHTPHVQVASSLLQDSTTASASKQKAASSSMQQQQEASDTLRSIPPQEAASSTQLQEAVGKSLCCMPEPKAAQERSCIRVVEEIEQQQQDLVAYQEAKGWCRPLLQRERRGPARSLHGDARCSSSRAVAAAAAVTKGSLSETTEGRFAFHEGDGGRVRADHTSLPSSSCSSPASMSSPFIAVAGQLAVSRVEPTSPSAASESGSNSSSRSRWLSLPFCCCCFLQAWSARRERGTASARSAGAITNTATLAAEGERPPPDLCSGSYNIYLLLVISAFTTLFSVTAQGQLFDNWLFFLGNKSTVWVGKAESISGMTSLLSALPVGLAVDRVDRSKLCKLGAVLGVISSVVSSLGCWWSSIRVVIISLILSGMTWELFTSAGSAIFTDTLDDFSRVYWFTVQGVVMTFCAAVGPGLMAVYFLIYGDSWDMPIMQRAIIGSTLFFGVGGSLLFCAVQNPPHHTRRLSCVASQEAIPAASVAVTVHGGRGPTPTAVCANEAAEGRREEDTGKAQLCVVEAGVEHCTVKSMERRGEADQLCERGMQIKMPGGALEDLDSGQRQERHEHQHQQQCSGKAASPRNHCSSGSTAYSSWSTQAPYSLVCSQAAEGRSGDEDCVGDSSSIGRKHSGSWWSNPSSRSTCAGSRSDRGRRTHDDEEAAVCSSLRGNSSSSGISGAAGHVLKEGLSLFGFRRKSSSRVARVDRRVGMPAPVARAYPAAATPENAHRSSHYSALPTDCVAPRAEHRPHKRAAASEATAEYIPVTAVKEGEATASSADCTCRSLRQPTAETGLLCPVHSTGEATAAAAAVACMPDGAPRHVRTSCSSVLSLVQDCCSAGQTSSFPAASSSRSSSTADGGVQGEQAAAAASTLAAAASARPSVAKLPYSCCGDAIAAACSSPEAVREPYPSQQAAPQCHLREDFATAVAPLLKQETEQSAANVSASAAPPGWTEAHTVLYVSASSAAPATHDRQPHDATGSPSSSTANCRTLPAEAWMNDLTSAQRKIPYLVAASDAVRALGGGMTVKFFPIFFEETYRFTPLQICYLASALFVGTGLFMIVGRSLAARLGRASAVCTLTFAGLCMLMSICVVQRVELLVVLYVLRGAVQNAAAPLTRSIVMDFTSTRNRGKWNAVQSFNSTLWSGSAFVGGFVADIDMRAAFCITGAVYLVAWVMFFPVVCLLPEAEKKFR